MNQLGLGIKNSLLPFFPSHWFKISNRTTMLTVVACDMRVA